MTTDKLLKRMHSMKVETGSLVCLGCGYEHNCSIHGCAILREAENAIRESAAEKDLPHQPTGWISIKDRLPDRTMPPHDVLVYHDLNCGMFIDRAWYSHDKNKWRNVVGMNLKVTHWMPLPEPPEEKSR